MGLARILLFIFNFIFVVLGILVIVSGVVIYTSDQDIQVLTTGSSLPFFTVGALTIALGVFIFVVAFTGCCGAWKENKCLLTVFIILLLIILLLEAAVVVLGYLYPGKVDDWISKAVQDAMSQYNTTQNTTFNQAWDDFQQDFNCCGLDNASDWQTYGPFKGAVLPSSCCSNTTQTCNTTSADVFNKGCKESVLKKSSSKTGLLFAGTSAIVILLAEIFGILFACCVIRDAEAKGKYA